MTSNKNVFRGLLLARSPTVLQNPPCTFLELQTHEGQKIKIIATNIKLLVNVECGKYYKFIDLQPTRLQEFDHVVYQLNHKSQIKLEEISLCREIDEQITHNFHGKVTAVDEDFGIYEVDDSKTLALSYLKQYCDWPTLQVGDEVEVKRTHLFTDRQGNHYYVSCLRSYLSIKSSTFENREREKSSAFIQFVEAYGLSVECLLWLRKHHHVIKDCIKDTFLQSLGVPNVNVLYIDVLLMLISTQEDVAEKIRRSSYKRNTLREFYSEPHCCLPLQIDCLRLPHKPLSLFEGLEPLLGMDVQNDEGSDWTFKISNTEYYRPFLGYIGISEKSFRLSLMDGNGLEIPVVPVQGKLDSEQDLRRFYKKIVLVEKPLLIVEKYTEEDELDPAAEYLNNSEYKYICMMVEVDDIKVFGPHDLHFSSWTNITVADFVKQNEQQTTTSPLFPLQEVSSLDSFVRERYIVLHKTPLQISSSKDISAYLMVKNLPSEHLENGIRNSHSSSHVFLKIRQPHANFYDLIPSSCELELRFPRDKADSIRTRRTAPWTYSLKPKLKITELIVIPAEVEIYIVGNSRRIYADVYSVVEAINDPCCENELISIMGIVASRSVDMGKFQREQWWITYNRNFGLPGMYSVLILDIRDPVSNPDSFGTSTRVYLSWQKSYQYPLGVVPGATVVVNFVYRTQANSKMYFRSTSLTSIEVVQLPKSSSSGAKLYVDVPAGPWLLPHQLSEGDSGWFIFEPRCLTKLELQTICKQCGEPYINGVCTYPGCSSPLGPKLSASARVLVEEGDCRDALLLHDEMVRLLLGVSGLEWSSLLVLTERTGCLRYNQKDEDTPMLVAFFVFYCNRLLRRRLFKWPNLLFNLTKENKLFL